MLRKIFIQIFIIILIMGVVSISQAERFSVAVFPFYFQKDFNNVLIIKETTNLKDNKKKSTIGVKSRLELIGLTDKLITELVSSRKFDVLERSRMDEIMMEHSFSNAKGMIDPSRIIQSAKMIAADYLIIGSVSVLEHDISYKVIPYINKLQEHERSKIIVDSRIIETSTGKIVSSNNIEAKLTNTNQVKKRRSSTVITKKVFDSLLRKLSKKLVLCVIDAVYPIKIAAFKSGVFFLNRGQGSGIKRGDRFTVFIQGEEIRDPDTAILLGNSESIAGTIIISDVLLKFSKAKALNSKQIFKVGSICRKELTSEFKKQSRSKEYPRHVKRQW